MPITFPLPPSDFAEHLRAAQSTFDLGEAVEALQGGRGEIITVENGPRLWAGSFALYTLSGAARGLIRSRLGALRSGGASFLVYDPEYDGPANDPGAAGIGVYLPQISNVDANETDVDLSGFPAGYVLAPGDRFSFQYGAQNEYYSLHEIVYGGTADGTGNMSVTVQPEIPAPTGAVTHFLELARPLCKAVVAPGSANPGSGRHKRWLDGMGFSWMQTHR